jgi:hypothetical protein
MTWNNSRESHLKSLESRPNLFQVMGGSRTIKMVKEKDYKEVASSK